jgi:hypothetical protein
MGKNVFAISGGHGPGIRVKKTGLGSDGKNGEFPVPFGDKEGIDLPTPVQGVGKQGSVGFNGVVYARIPKAKILHKTQFFHKPRWKALYPEDFRVIPPFRGIGVKPQAPAVFKEGFS